MKSWIVLCGFLLFTSCTLFDNTELLPMYFKVDTVQFQTSSSQGFNTHKINDISVYADGYSIGVYPLPVQVPVIQSRDNVEVVLFGVVRNNGIASNPVEYPFYEPLTYNFPFEPQGIKQLNPVFKYSSQSKIDIVADFETANEFSVDYDENSNIKFVRSADTPYGNFCGKITTTSDQLVFEKTTFSQISRSQVIASSVFLELDYKNEIPFSVGILGIQSNGLAVPNYKVQLTEQEEWNKVYIELTDLLTDNLIETFSIVLKSSITNSKEGTVLIDNLRVLHF